MRPAPSTAPFAYDTWPLCEPWERAGQITDADRQLIAGWARDAQDEIRLELDHRLDMVAERIRQMVWPGVE